jgi:hypothetical protein
MELRLSIILAFVLMLLSSNASAFADAGSVVVDIVGSNTDNTRIVSSGIEKVELEIIGSTSKNTTIASPAMKTIECKMCCGPYFGCEYKQECKPVSRPWDNMHLGVDAWYGTFWYTNINMPKWP